MLIGMQVNVNYASLQCCTNVSFIILSQTILVQVTAVIRFFADLLFYFVNTRNITLLHAATIKAAARGH